MDSVDDKKLTWWQKGIIYQVYIKSFKDSNGDGVGDLRGVIEKIDYFKLIGVDIIFINPFYPHGGKDNGYDLTSYYDIDPVFGTMSDFDDLVDQLHRNDMYLVIDFIPNHTSSLHEWFIKSCESDSPDNPYHDYYIWYPSDNSVNPPNNWLPVAGKSAWTYVKKRKAWYYHSFLEEQPNLNLRCPHVKAEMKKVIKYWLQTKKVDGIRIDAAKHFFVNQSFKDEPKKENLDLTIPRANLEFESYNHIYIFNQPENYEILADWRKYINGIEEETNRKKLLYIESYETPDMLKRYFYFNGRQVTDFPLNFEFINLCETARINIANIREFKKFEPFNVKSFIDEWLACSDTPYFCSNWQLDNQDCARVASRIGVENTRTALALCLLIGGTPLTYYGEEIGMENLDYDSIAFEECQDNFALTFGPEGYKAYNRDYCRSPMQWDGTTNAGFTGDETKPWLKIHPNYISVNVKQQLESPNSVLNVYMQLTRIRQNPSFLVGSFEYALVNEHIFSFIRKADGYPSFLVVMNLSDQEIKTDFDGIKEKLSTILKVVYYFDNGESSNDFKNSQTVSIDNILFLQRKSCLILSFQKDNP